MRIIELNEMMDRAGKELMKAQLRHSVQTTLDALDRDRYADDTGDYLGSALGLAHELHDEYTVGASGFDVLMKVYRLTDPVMEVDGYINCKLFQDYATDGICDALWVFARNQGGLED